VKTSVSSTSARRSNNDKVCFVQVTSKAPNTASPGHMTLCALFLLYKRKQVDGITISVALIYFVTTDGFS
jgi:hypothetical protein